MLLRGFESRLGLESLGCCMWHFLKLVARGFLWVLRFPPILHQFNGSADKIKFKWMRFQLGQTWAVPSYQWHVTWHLHVISALPVLKVRALRSASFCVHLRWWQACLLGSWLTDFRCVVTEMVVNLVSSAPVAVRCHWCFGVSAGFGALWGERGHEHKDGLLVALKTTMPTLMTPASNRLNKLETSLRRLSLPPDIRLDSHREPQSRTTMKTT